MGTPQTQQLSKHKANLLCPFVRAVKLGLEARAEAGSWRAGAGVRGAGVLGLKLGVGELGLKLGVGELGLKLGVGERGGGGGVCVCVCV